MNLAKKLLGLMLPALLAACSSAGHADSSKLRVVTSTQIIGDVAGNIGGDLVDVEFLIPQGTDPHAFETTPHDAVRLAEGDLVFINGFGLEQTIQPLLNDIESKVVPVSKGIPALAILENGESGPDPHVWMNPLNIKIWADNIAQALAQADPDHEEVYASNAEAYKTKIDQLDAWGKEQVDQIKTGDRVLVTDHESFAYFAKHYDFQVIGVLIPSYSTLSETSAGELADLETSIWQLGAKAIFVGMSLNPSLAERVAADTGIQLVPVYTESLSDANGPAPTYIGMIRFDVLAIVAALK